MNSPTNNEILKELRDWQERIDHLRTENNQMKYGLAKAILKDVSISFLEASENFYEILLDKEQAMDLIRHEIVILLSVAVDELNFQSQYAVLKRDTERFEKDFYALKIRFLNHFVI